MWSVTRTMAFTVLIADDDPYTRQLIRRVISKDLDVRLLEAEHGVAALDLLLTERVDLVLLDVSMPVMDGIETLRALRRAPEYADLPVIILAGRAEEQQVMRLVELGIKGFLVKPFRPVVLAERVARILQRRDLDHAMPVPARWRLDLHAHSRVLLIDHSPEFCEFFVDQLRPLCEVQTAASLAAGMTVATDCLPDAVFVGSTDRLLETELFVRKLRMLSGTSGPRVVLLVPPGGELCVPERLFDGVVTRSYVSGILQESLRAVLTEGAAARWVFSARGPQALAFGAAAAARVEGLLRTSLVRETARPDWTRERGRWMVAALEVSAHGLAWDLRVQMPCSVALRVGSTMTQVDVGAMSEEGLGSTMLLLTEWLGEDLLALAHASQVSATCAEPRVSTSPVYVVREPRAREDAGSYWWFSLPDHPAGVSVALIPLAPSLARPVTAAAR